MGAPACPHRWNCLKAIASTPSAGSPSRGPSGGLPTRNGASYLALMAEVIVPFRRQIAVLGDPDTVFAQLRDPERLIQCVPGGQLTQVVNPRAFKGHLTVNVGPFALPYSGVGHITLSGQGRRQSTIALEGHGPVGAGNVFAEVTLSVEGYGQGSRVLISARVAVSGVATLLGTRLVHDTAEDLMIRTSNRLRTYLDGDTHRGRRQTRSQ